MNLRKRERWGNTEIDLTPMIDCIFNLLIFLMCINTISIIVGISIKIPSDDNSFLNQPAKVEQQLKICFMEDEITTGHKIVKEGVIKLNGVKVDLKNYEEIFQYQRKRIPKNLLIIEAENKVYHGVIIKIMDITQKIILKDGKKTTFSFQPAVENIEDSKEMM
ncbi:MAG: biopolymer transporter ExbD [bacterium]